MNLRNPVLRYALLGFGVGILGVLVSTILVTYDRGMVFAFASFIEIQQTQKVLWFIDLMPLALGSIFAILGNIRYRLQESARELENLVEERTRKLSESNQKLLEENQERQKIEQVLSRAKREWEVVFDSVKDMILIIDQSGQIVRCNRMVIERFHKSFSEVIGLNINRLFYGEDEPQNNIFFYQEDFCQFSSLSGWYEVSEYPIDLEPSGKGCVFIVRDITDRHHRSTSGRD